MSRARTVTMKQSRLSSQGAPGTKVQIPGDMLLEAMLVERFCEAVSPGWRHVHSKPTGLPATPRPPERALPFAGSLQLRNVPDNVIER